MNGRKRVGKSPSIEAIAMHRVFPSAGHDTAHAPNCPFLLLVLTPSAPPAPFAYLEIERIAAPLTAPRVPYNLAYYCSSPLL